MIDTSVLCVRQMVLPKSLMVELLIISGICVEEVFVVAVVSLLCLLDNEEKDRKREREVQLFVCLFYKGQKDGK